MRITEAISKEIYGNNEGWENMAIKLAATVRKLLLAFI
jgi:hypothetical protein